MQPKTMEPTDGLSLEPESLEDIMAGIELPPDEPLTPEELERRRKLFDEITQLRDKIGPIGMSVVDLIDMDFYDIVPPEDEE